MVNLCPHVGAVSVSKYSGRCIEIWKNKSRETDNTLDPEETRHANPTSIGCGNTNSSSTCEPVSPHLDEPLVNDNDSKPQNLHPLQAEILEIAEENPGFGFNCVVHSTEKPRSTIRHHLYKMLSNGLLKSFKNGRELAYYKTDANRDQPTPLERLKRHSKKGKVVRELQETGFSPSLNHLARKLDLDRRLTHATVQTLEHLGIVAVSKENNRHRIRWVGPS